MQPNAVGAYHGRNRRHAQLAQGEKMDFTKTGLTVSKGILAMDTKRVIGVLKDLIISCTISSTGDDDVLSREGIPIPANQDLLREQHVPPPVIGSSVGAVTTVS